MALAMALVIALVTTLVTALAMALAMALVVALVMPLVMALVLPPRMPPSVAPRAAKWMPIIKGVGRESAALVMRCARGPLDLARPALAAVVDDPRRLRGHHNLLVAVRGRLVLAPLGRGVEALDNPHMSCASSAHPRPTAYAS